jgi:hypothetical protein
VDGNVSEGNLVGGELGGGNHVVERNAFIGNAGVGLQVVGTAQVVRRNSILGNLDDGIRVFAPGAITQNNIYGNKCGLHNVSGAIVDAPNNFWGDPAGPGVDPADQVCDLAGSVTTTTPAAASAFPVNVK